MDVRQHIREIPDFPKPGILFYDISTLLADAGPWGETVRQMATGVAAYKPDLLVGIESRGFLVASALAYEMKLGFQMIRKKGKLPGPTVSFSYDLEYGSDTIEIQKDAVKPGQRIVVLDDLLATGGTLRASCELLRKLGADVVGVGVIMELAFLDGRKGLDTPFFSLVTYES